MSKLIISHPLARGDSLFLEEGRRRVTLRTGNKMHPEGLHSLTGIFLLEKMEKTE